MVSLILVAGMGLTFFQMTEPEEFAGRWTGQLWTTTSMSAGVEPTGFGMESFGNAEIRRSGLQLRISESKSQSSLQSTFPSAGGSRLIRMAGCRILESVGAATSLGRYIREIRANLHGAEEKTQDAPNRASIAKLKRDLTAAEFERETAIAILEAQLEAAKKLNESQDSLRQLVQLQVEEGSVSSDSLWQINGAQATASAEIRQLELLLEYYASLGTEEATTFEDDRNIIFEVLRIRAETTKKQLNLHADWSQHMRDRFKAGDGEINDVLQAEQAEARATAEVREIEALLDYFTRFGTKGLEPR